VRKDIGQVKGLMRGMLVQSAGYSM